MVKSMRKIIRFTEKDNVAVVLEDVKPGLVMGLDGADITVGDEIPYGHKIALSDIAAGEKVYKYGEPVARCIKDIKKGEWVHVHNVESIRGLGR
ncbi:SAF domain protein [Clostridiales bacterium 1_7_47FAA]|nr:SAF domain protein [Clostridiales bacterium 1_7_47FAA]